MSGLRERRWGQQMKRIVLGLVVALAAVLLPGVAEAVGPLLVLSGPASVQPAELITVTGTLVDAGGLPLARVDVQTGAVCLDPQQLIGTSTTRTDNQGHFSFGLTAGVCRVYRLDARYMDPSTGEDGYDSIDVLVNRTPTSLAVTAPPAAYTQADVPVSLTLTADGSPLASASVTLHRVQAGSWLKTWDLTTDESGVATVVDSITTPGTYTYDAAFGGTVTENHVYSSSSAVGITRRPVALTIDGPADAVIDEPFTLTGTLSGPPLPAQVTITGPSYNQTVTTDPDGSFEASVVSSVGGDTQWSVGYPEDVLYGSAHASISVTVPKLVTTFELSLPSSVQVGEPIVVTGRLTGVDQATTIFRKLDPVLTGPGLLTASDGSFEIVEPTTYPGTAHLDFRYPGDARHAAATASRTVAVLPEPVTMSLSVRAEPGDQWGRHARICLQISGSHLPVVVRAKDRAGTVYRVTDGYAGDSGCLDRQFARAVRITAVAPQDGEHSGASASAAFTPGSYVYSVPTRALRYRDPYSVYEHGAHPLIVSRLDAPQPGSCLRHQLQRRVAHHWRTVVRTTCNAQDGAGRSQWRMRGRHPIGSKFRVRAIFAGDVDVHGTRGRWAYLRFT
jgi:hypothetical protein